MRLRLVAAILTMLLGGCGQSDYLVSDGRELPPQGGAGLARYTTHISTVTSVEVIAIRIDPFFAADERARILSAIGHWNYALNRYIRFDPTIGPLNTGTRDATAPTEWPTYAWTIVSARGGALSDSARRLGYPLAGTIPGNSSRGMVLVYVDRFYRRDLAAVVLHELGHVLGLGHDQASQLMSVHFDSENQQCVDKAAMAALAASRNLPLEELNWCEKAPPSDEAPRP